MILQASAYWNCKRYEVIISDLSGNWNSMVLFPFFWVSVEALVLVVSGFGGGSRNGS